MIYFILAVAFLVLFFYWRFYLFFRDPDRSIPSGRVIVSPADGTVVYVKKIDEGVVPISIKRGKEVSLDSIAPDCRQCRYIVGIFMHPTSVHVNRAPIAGEVVAQNYYKASANLPMTIMWLRVLLGMRPYEKKSGHILKNERNIIKIRGEFEVAVVQIADIYVNKIKSRVSIGDHVNAGDRIGSILLGSQVDLVLPEVDNIKFCVSPGDRVLAGSSVIAEY